MPGTCQAGNLNLSAVAWHSFFSGTSSNTESKACRIEEKKGAENDSESGIHLYSGS